MIIVIDRKTKVVYQADWVPEIDTNEKLPYYELRLHPDIQAAYDYICLLPRCARVGNKYFLDAAVATPSPAVLRLMSRFLGLPVVSGDGYLEVEL